MSPSFPARVALCAVYLYSKASLQYDVDLQPRSRVNSVVQIVVAGIRVEVHVNVVRVIPVVRPGIIHSKPKSAVLETRISAANKLGVEAEEMIASKVGAEPVVRNAAATVFVAH